MRKAIIGGVFFLALSFGAGQAQTPASPANAKIAAQFEKARAEYEADRTKAAHDTLAALTRSRAFLAETPEVRGRILALDAQVASDLGMVDYAAVAARSASKLPGQQGLVAQMAVYEASRGGPEPDANAIKRRALTVLATQHPDTLSLTPDRIILSTAGRPALNPAEEAEEAALDEALLASWRPRNALQVIDFLKLTVIRKDLATGRVDEARRMTTTLGAANVGRTIRSDRRYDGLFADGWSLPTPREMTEDQLARLRATRAKNPQWIYGAWQEAALLSALHADAEAVQVIDAALAQAGRAPTSFRDTTDYLGALRERRGELLGRLHGWEQEVAARRQAAATSEHGQANVSSVLNMAVASASEEPKEALRLVDLALSRGVSAYGRGVGLRAQACAHQALGQTAEAEAARRALMAMRDNGANMLKIDVALCMGDADGVAAGLVSSLGNPGERQQALELMQVDWPDADPPRNDIQRAQKALLRIVVHRADVQAALAPHGRIVKIDAADVWRR
ncbi:MAG: hypothetical protein J0I28_02200 [Caulobacterales bacterium]|nr:hypothetical protein [Caulobacterales bacterium]